MGKYLPQKGKIRENNSCLNGTRYFRGPFPFSANISPILTTGPAWLSGKVFDS